MRALSGKGELSGLIANLRALMVVIAAPIFGRISLFGRASGLPGAPLLAVAFMTALAEVVHRTVEQDVSQLSSGAKSAAEKPKPLSAKEMMAKMKQEKAEKKAKKAAAAEAAAKAKDAEEATGKTA